MRQAIALAGFAVLIHKGIAIMPDKEFDTCKQGHRGLLYHIRDHSDMSKGCKVTVVLKKDCLKLLR